MRTVIFLLSFFILFFLMGKFNFNAPVVQSIFQKQSYNAYPKMEQQQNNFASISSGQRLTTDDPEAMQGWIEQINKSRGFNVVFLGDSIVYGDGTMDESQTIPSLLRQKIMGSTGRPVNMFNLTLPSAGPAEVYLITRELAKAKVDLLIYDINIGWLDRDEILEHPVLLKLGENKNLDPADFQVDNLEEVTANHYNLYDEDENLKELATSWTQKSWAGILDSADMGKFGRINLEWSEQWKYVQKTVSLLQEHHIKALFFANPRNFDLLDNYNLIDYQRYTDTLGVVFRYLEASGVTVLNLDRAVPSEYFSDLVHLLPAGEEIVSGRLSDFVIQSGLFAVKDNWLNASSVLQFVLFKMQTSSQYELLQSKKFSDIL